MKSHASSLDEPVKSKEELIEKYRHYNVEHDWWDWQYADYVERMEAVGISIDAKDIHFSGFWCQGDGASFSGYIHETDMKRFMEIHKLSEYYPEAFYFAVKDELGVKLVRSSHHYSHENTINIDLQDDSLDYSDFDEDDVRGVIYQAMRDAYYVTARDLEEEIQQICRGYMKDLYLELQKEYEYLTSDECVLETIEANNLTEE